MDQKAEQDELLQIEVNAICAKINKEGYSPYEMMFGASPEWLLSPAMSSVESFPLKDKELHLIPGRY